MEKKSNDSILDDDFLDDKKQIKNLRAKEQHKTRRKIDAYLERKNLQELLDGDIDDFDWED